MRENLKIWKSNFVLNSLSFFLAFIFAAYSRWSAFIDTENPQKISPHCYISIVCTVLCYLLIFCRWKKRTLWGRVLSVFVCLLALDGPFACLITYVDWFHQFKWLYSP